MWAGLSLMLLEGLAPVYERDARILILGSMPGQASLDEQQYYAHPRNLFWPLMAHALRAELPNLYQDRLSWAKANGIALWDVLRHCRREGSLDSSIERRSEVPNDIPRLIHALPELNAILLNGKKAEQIFRRCMCPSLDLHALNLIVLPSSSPANASISVEIKRERWANAIRSGLAI